MEINDIKDSSVKVSAVLKVLSHPQRLCMLYHLHGGRKTVGQLQELCDISQSHVSQFLSKMKLQNLVTSQKEGNYVYFSIEDPKIVELLQSIHSIYCADEFKLDSLENS